MKKLLTLTLITVCAAGALQAKQQTRQPKPAFGGWHSAATQPAEAPITDTKKLEKHIKKLNRKIRTLSANLTRASEKGEEQKVRTLNAKLTRKRDLQRRYTLQLVALKSAEKKKEKVAKKTEKKEKAPKKKHEKKAGKSKSK